MAEPQFVTCAHGLTGPCAQCDAEPLWSECDLCHGTLTVPVSGPDENGQYDTDDCPCQRKD